MKHAPCQGSAFGFTLIELLVVIGIISLLSSIAMVNLSSTREKARLARAIQFESSVHHALAIELIGEWLLDGNANDSSGNGFNGILQGGVTAKIAPECVISSGCYHFDGSGYINLGSGDFGIGISDFTISLWVRTNQQPASVAHLFADQQGLSPGFYVAFWQEALTTSLRTAGAGLGHDFIEPPINDGRWHNVILVFNRDGRMRGFLDGKLLEWWADLTGHTTSISNAVTQYIAWDGVSSEKFVGYIDRIRLYKGAIE